jgi:ubiquinone/menaquinone biosynthesis C-methylase UbiE
MRKLPEEIIEHYKQFDEQARLATSIGQLELARTQDILKRHLIPPPATILDVGGGPGRYACWLAAQGYKVHLIDPVAVLVEQAKQTSQSQSDCPVASFTVGDARQLDFPNEYADVVLLMGPLYHLTERKDRLIALREAFRALRQGGLLCAVGISRFASTMDGIFHGFLDDPQFSCIVERDLTDGQHRNSTQNLAYFTTTFFHRPEELQIEIEEAGFVHESSLAIEGIGYMLQNFMEQWENPRRKHQLLDILRKLEKEPSLIGVSAHIMAVATKG